MKKHVEQGFHKIKEGIEGVLLENKATEAAKEAANEGELLFKSSIIVYCFLL